MAVDWEKIVRVHNRIKAELSEEQRKWEDTEAKLKGKLEEITNFMLSALNESNMDSVKTAAGTFYRSEKLVPTGADWGAFYRWVAENDAFDALERRIKATFITQYMADHDNALPPGVSVFRQYKVGVRKN
jgi:hypothetical protein